MASNQLIVTVDSQHVETRSGEKNGKQWTVSNQAVWCYFTDPTGVADKFPTKIQISLGKGQLAYKNGDYAVCPSSFYRGEYDRLSMRLALTSVTK